VIAMRAVGKSLLPGRPAKRFVAAAVALISVLAHPGAASAAPDVERISGKDRYETAVAISKLTFGKTSDVVIARGDAFADAAAASYLSGAINETPHPILLTPSDQLPDVVFAELQRLGPRKVWLMGDANAISKAVEDRIKTLNVAIVRVGGKDRYDTARLLVTDARLPMGRTAFLVNGKSPADAISVAALSAAAELPLLYTTPDALHPSAKRAIEFGGFRRVVIVGGPLAIGEQVANDLAAICPKGTCVKVERIAGQDRTETAVAIAKWAIANVGFSAKHLNVVRGDRFTDAAAAAAHAAVERSPLLTTTSPTVIGPGLEAWMAEMGTTVKSIDVIGDTSAVSDAVVQRLTSLMK
jgi:putative cell wall-binding protein